MTRFPSPEQWAVLEAVLREVSPAERAALTHGWSVAAQQEHASIASFSKFSLELMAVGAPAALLARAHQAALDEIDHARMSFRVASLCAGKPLGPGPLTFSASSIAQSMSLPASAVAAAIDGCFNETLAALEAGAAAEASKPEALRLVLEEIARDEQGHAELAWEYVAWAIATGGSALRQAVADAAQAAMRRLEVEAEPAPGQDLGHWGLLAPQVRRQLRSRSRRDVLAPAFARLLAPGV